MTTDAARIASSPTWRVLDSDRGPGEMHMATDRATLASLTDESAQTPVLHFFQWDRPSISYGYLLNKTDVEAWAQPFNNAPMIQRPTGGGAVWHDSSDLSFSLAWNRSERLFASNPRACYGEIHTIAKEAVQPFFPMKLTLFAKPAGSECADMGAAPTKRFSACFEEPVCNDVMVGRAKILGGALRVGRTAMLYQGTIRLATAVDFAVLKNRLADAFQTSAALRTSWR